MSDLTGYNLVLASTESALNSSLEYSKLWEAPINYQLAPDSSPADSPGLFDVYVAPPKLTISGSDLANNQVSVSLQFKSGTLQYVNIINPQIPILSTDIAGWTLSFVTTIRQGPIPEGADMSGYPEQVQAAALNELLSVGQLFLDLVGTTWGDSLITDAAGNPVKDTTITSTLVASLQGWVQSIESTMQRWVLSFSIDSKTVPDASEPENLVAPLIPTSCDFSTSKYDPPGDYDYLSTINYLMMTNGAPAPTSNIAGIFNFNWIEGPNTQEYQGAVAIDGALFNSAYVEALLLPAIAKAVGATAPTISKTGTGQWSISQTVNLYGNQNDGKGQKKEGLGVQRVYENVIEYLDCEVKLDPGTATYEVSGNYQARSIITLEFVGWDKTDSSFTCTYILPWTFNIRLKPGPDGAVVAESTEVQTEGTMTVRDGDDFVGDLMNAISEIFSLFLDTYSAQFENKAKSISQQSFDTISDELKLATGEISKSVVFPAGGNFTYKDVIFTDDPEQNLIAYLTYTF